MPTGIVEAVIKELNENSHIRNFQFKVTQDGDAIVVTGVVPSFYQKQQVIVSAMRILQNFGFQLRNEIEVDRSKFA
jgi:DNA/RNA endonuclease YhcR with UshA esterase domain